MNEDTFTSVNPSQPDQVIGYFSRATVEQANEAVQAASTAFESWKKAPAEERCRLPLRRCRPHAPAPLPF